MKWSIVYKGCYTPSGETIFHKLTHEFLSNAKRTLGSYMFANQYLNEVIPSDLQTFKREWITYYSSLPETYNTYIFIDPALSKADGADFTGVVVVHVDTQSKWYVSFARRYKLSPTEIVDLVFELYQQFKPQVIGIEAVAYQKALFYFIHEEMRRRGILLPLKDVIPPNTKTKEARILSLVPRLEWGHMILNQGLQDLELEMMQFPRGVHDDLIDALASIEYISSTPSPPKNEIKKVGPQHKDYEKWWIQNHLKHAKEDEHE